MEKVNKSKWNIKRQHKTFCKLKNKKYIDW